MQQQRPRGRRPGPSVTREVIAEAAAALFAEVGYERATVRAIAARAGVDPRLVTHRFGTKQELFVQVMSPPIDPETIATALVGDPAGTGERLARVMVALLTHEPTRWRFLGLVRAAATEPAAATLLREVVERAVLAPVAARLPGPDASLRVALAGSQLVGLVMVGHVVQVGAVADADPEQLVRLLAPVLQHYLGPSLPSSP
ncbi:MAG: TetR family transcriptional regulator [Actinobacteria bacterium]|nr:TetR family transcriptional regulator [Actinomycetota bacterium]MCG2800690.1 TetR family transcriptional regulator [Cellulomonas sp.]